MGSEVEVKLGAGPAFRLPNLDGVLEGAVVQSPEVLRLETVAAPSGRPTRLWR